MSHETGKEKMDGSGKYNVKCGYLDSEKQKFMFS